MPPTGWLNDPNGLCHFRGVYHVFFQYSPTWPEPHAPRGWGHATSCDLVTWEQHGMAIAPELPEEASGAYSGSAAIVPDAASDGGDLMCLYYTGNVKLPGNYDYIHVGREANEIRVESEAGKGSRFTVTLPFAAAEPDTDAPGGGGREADCPRFSLRGLRILLAEDNEINMEVTAELLRAQGAQVPQAWNGAEAVERFQSLPPNSFDAVLLDMQMPELDGCEAARRLRALPRPDAGTVPIIAVTANAFAEDVAATSAAGMDAHVSKPIDLTALSDVLKRLLASR